MPEVTNKSRTGGRAARVSLDAWAVAVALALAALIWAGVIKHVPW